ncbi:MAG TPA: hypothetical protein VN041_06180 [Microbacterium sp.]|jgi:hypothetical protein|uniref:hypothetical protein n=1 Tax=Microbacterium TaxID=33882 RepID=UPI002555E229|nr:MULTISPECIES: hypothetical protein [Microbacterium]GLC86680.1 hypothetical protein MIAR_32650 [Microbacterium arabinogalactanolyticum]HWU28669.1 hypothetical protein [Microbacterium sp.]
MTQQDMLFLVMLVIGLTGLTVLTLQLLKRPKRDQKGEWYEGPWDDDDRPRGPHNG